MKNCRRCGFKKWIKTETPKWIGSGDRKVRVRKCANCGEEQAEEFPFFKNKPSEFYFDIERSPGLAYYYDRKVDYIPTHMLKTEPFIICWAAGWVTDCDDFQYVSSMVVTPEEALRRDDRRILKALWGLLDIADRVIGHNVNGFDVKKVNNRFIQHDMGLPYESKTIDTLVLSRKHFPFESNGLDYIAVKLGGRPKLDIGWDDWRQIVETGNDAKLIQAERYCRGDVREGIKVYKFMKRTIETSGRRLIKL